MSQRQRRVRRGVGRPGDGEDVRGAIVSAALRQLEAAVIPDRVTVSAIIAEAGCTPPSLYHYWPTRELLLREASALGWAQFRSSQAAAVADSQEPDYDQDQDPGEGPPRELGEGSGQDPVERLRRRGRAYLDFALSKPSLFRVLFLEPTAAGPTAPATGAAAPTAAPTVALAAGPAAPAAGAGQALQDLVADVSAAMAAGQLRTADPVITALALWSAMHGVAALWAVTPSLPTDLAHAVGDVAQDAFFAGLAT